jgi:hypothetical protein
MMLDGSLCVCCGRTMIGMLMFWTMAYVPRKSPAHAQMLERCQLRLTSHVMVLTTSTSCSTPPYPCSCTTSISAE